MNLDKSFLDNIISTRKFQPLRGDPKKALSWQEGITKRLLVGDKKIKVKNVTYRLAFIFLLAVCMLLILTARFFNLQIIHGERNYVLSEENRIRIQIIRPERGIIYDRNGAVLARNSPGFKVVLDLGKVLEYDMKSVVEKLSSLLSVSSGELVEKIKKDRDKGLSLVTIQEGVPRELIFKIEANQEELPGVSTEVSPIREYLYPEILAHVIGYTGEISKEELSKPSSATYLLGDRIGKTGLESVYDEYLHGVHGKYLLETDAYGRVLKELAKKDAIPGDGLGLTLDIKLQEVASRSLKKHMAENNASGGVVIVSNPNTGEILSMVSYPSYDPNMFSKILSFSEYEKIVSDPAEPLFNRAISSTYPPGSTFKMVTATAALEEGVITPKTRIEEVQTISVGAFTFSNWTLAWGVAPHGLLDVVQAIAHSSDIFFYEVGGGYGDQEGLGVTKIADWSKKFGLGTQTQIDLTGEAAGLIPTQEWKKDMYGEPWYLGDSYVLAIGQGYLLVTPLQLTCITNVFANGGKLKRPYLLKEIKDPGGKGKVYQKEVTVLKDFISSETLKLVRQGMREAVIYGTSVELKNFKVPVAGKTGTSETGESDINHAWYTAFAPFEAPEIVVTAFLEGGGSGSVAALPVVKEIMEEYFK